MKSELKDIKKIIDGANNILIIQADNPDGDSLGSALALEQILGDMGKNPSMYCGVDIPDYLKFLKGWDRVQKTIPSKIDASIIVDTSSHMLLQKLEQEPGKTWVATKPVIVLDHHSDVSCDIPYATVVYNSKVNASTGELIYDIAKQNNWPVSLEAQNNIMQSILSDTLGLTTQNTTAESYRRIADMVEAGVNRPALEESRRNLAKMSQAVFRYKADLIKRVEFYGNNDELAVVTIPEEELFTVGTEYNPAPLILGELSMVDGVKVGIAFKKYTGKVTAAIRCTNGSGIAARLAKKYGGGGHEYSAGFKIEKPVINFADLKHEVITSALELLK